MLLNLVPGYQPAGAEPRDVVDFNEWQAEDPEDRRTVGLPADYVYEAIFRRERRFVLREPRDIVLPEPKDAEFALLIGACLGRLETDQAKERQYLHELSAERLPVGPENLWSAFVNTPGRSPIWGPLGVAGQGLSVGREYPGEQLVVLIMRGRSPQDVVAYWNLRAAGFFVLPFPVEWQSELMPQLVELDQQLGDDGERLDEIHVMCSPWLPRSKCEQLTKRISEAVRCVTARYPLWRASGTRRDLGQAIEDEHRLQATWSGERVEVPLSPPAFLDDVRSHVRGRWVNVLEIEPSFVHSEIASLFPHCLDTVDRLLGTYGLRRIRAAREGLVVTVADRTQTLLMRPPSGVDVWLAFLSARGMTAKLSPPGRTALEVIRRLGGLEAVRLIQDWGLLSTLVRAADVEPDYGADRARASSQRHPRRFIKQEEMKAALRRLHNAHLPSAERHLRQLTEREVIRAGLTIRCEECQHRNFLEPDALGDEMRCELCLRHLAFPHYKPPTSWAYRARGGFRLQGWGDGSYSVALALHCLTELTDGASRSWTTNLDVDGLGELDFGLLVRERAWYADRQPELLVGECKSQGHFERADVERARRVRDGLNEAIFVFATLAEELGEQERTLITELARPSVVELDRLPVEPDVMVLTRLELFARDDLDDAWHTAGGNIAALAPVRNWRYHNPYRGLCGVTQQMHLGLEPWASWHNTERDRLLQRRTDL